MCSPQFTQLTKKRLRKKGCLWKGRRLRRNNNNMKYEDAQFEQFKPFIPLTEELLSDFPIELYVEHLNEMAGNPRRYSIRYGGLNLRPLIYDNISKCIKRRPAQKIFNAYDFAESIGTPINYYCVIVLHENEDQFASDIFAIIRRLYSEWLRRRSNRDGVKYSPTYIYTIENPKDHIHVNWCLHIPDVLEQEFSIRVREWVELVQGPLTPETVYTKKVRHGIDAYKALANYSLKGIDPRHADRFFLADLLSKHGPQGPVFGKRAGHSQAIGKTAQTNARFNPTGYRQKRMERLDAERNGEHIRGTFQ